MFCSVISLVICFFFFHFHLYACRLPFRLAIVHFLVEILGIELIFYLFVLMDLLCSDFGLN